MSERLNQSPDPFAGRPDSYLIRRMERATDFGYDDEEQELTRRLSSQGKAWKWSDDFFNPKVIIYDTEPTTATEQDLMDKMLDIDQFLTPEGQAATEEYYRRQAEKINNAMSERAIRRALEDD